MQKLELYKRIASIETEEEYSDMSDELLDRYGEPPMAVMNLLKVALLKAKAHHAFLIQIEQKGNHILFGMNKNARVKVEEIDPLLKREQYRNKMKFQMPDAAFVYTWKGGTKKELLLAVEQVIDDIDSLIFREENEPSKEGYH